MRAYLLVPVELKDLKVPVSKWIWDCVPPPRFDNYLPHTKVERVIMVFDEDGKRIWPLPEVT